MRGKRLQKDKTKQPEKLQPQGRSRNRSNAKSSSLHPFLELQQTVGNQSVQRLLKSESDRPTFEVSDPKAAAEQQAEYLAERTTTHDSSSDAINSTQREMNSDFGDVQIHHDARAA